jgi:acetyl esterase/lipase
MPKPQRLVLHTILLLTLASNATTAEPLLTKNVWPATAPGETGDIPAEAYRPARPGAKQVKRLGNVSVPTIAVYKPAKDKDTGTAVVVCPGGGYSILAMDLEGTEVCEWLNSIGVTGVLLKYRVPRRKNRPPYEAPLQDAQRAVSMVRSEAEKLGIHKDRIGILGFSAGGNLAAVASTNFAKRSYEAIDQIDEVDCRPNFTVLVYPAYLTKDGVLIPELPVGKNTPPAFLVHAGNDGVPAENSVQYYLGLRKQKVPAELHIYASGGHGFGLRKSEFPISKWPQRCEAWLRGAGLLGR